MSVVDEDDDDFDHAVLRVLPALSTSPVKSEVVSPYELRGKISSVQPYMCDTTEEKIV